MKERQTLGLKRGAGGITLYSFFKKEIQSMAKNLGFKKKCTTPLPQFSEHVSYGLGEPVSFVTEVIRFSH